LLFVRVLNIYGRLVRLFRCNVFTDPTISGILHMVMTNRMVVCIMIVVIRPTSAAKIRMEDDAAR